MSSIAYITDHQMIEYHRLHGNTNIIFWRPASQKKFTDFHYGDYLFFLTKGTEKGKEREKGIIGYGKYTKEDIRSVHDVWKKYETMTGYRDEVSFQDAVKKMNKLHELPNKMHCLYLESLNFFQTPIYLSEIDQKISKQIESYVYLDQIDHDTSWKILQEALQVGTDMWSTLVEHQHYTIQQDADILLIQTIYEQLYVDQYSDYEKKKLKQFVKQYKNTAHGDFLASSCNDFFILEDGIIHIYIPCLTALKTWKKYLLICIARFSLYQNKLQDKHSTSHVSILLDHPNEDAIELCKLARVNFDIDQIK